MKRTAGWLLAMMLLAGAAHAQTTTPALIDSVQHRAFQYFWDQANPANGLIRDRSEPTSPCSIAAE